MERILLNREQSCSFTMPIKEETVKQIQKQVRIDDLYKEHLIYLFGKFNNCRFLT